MFFYCITYSDQYPLFFLLPSLHNGRYVFESSQSCHKLCNIFHIKRIIRTNILIFVLLLLQNGRYILEFSQCCQYFLSFHFYTIYTNNILIFVVTIITQWQIYSSVFKMFLVFFKTFSFLHVLFKLLSSSLLLLSLHNSRYILEPSESFC